MKPTDFLSGIVHLFNDLIGHVVPGVVLIIGLIYLHCIPESGKALFMTLPVSMKWFLTIVVTYVIGHGLTSLHRVIQIVLDKPMKCISSMLKFEKPKLKDNDELISSSTSYKGFSKLIELAIATKTKESIDYKFEVRNLRSMAMTASKEAGVIARRFMFISLFCYGVSMAILVLSIIYLSNGFSFEWAFYLFALFFLFYDRGIVFEYRASNVPFAIALSEILIENKNNDGQND